MKSQLWHGTVYSRKEFWRLICHFAVCIKRKSVRQTWIIWIQRIFYGVVGNFIVKTNKQTGRLSQNIPSIGEKINRFYLPNLHWMFIKTIEFEIQSENKCFNLSDTNMTMGIFCARKRKDFKKTKTKHRTKFF